MKQKHVIVKADDYARTGSCLDPWRRFVGVMCDNHCVASVGVVGGALGTNRIPKSLAPFLRAIVQEYRWEVWNHSQHHRDMRSMSAAEIEADIKTSQRVIEEEIGVRPRIFGPPFNFIDDASASAIAEAEQFDGYYFVDHIPNSARSIARGHLLAVELGTAAFRPIRFNLCASEINRRQCPDFLVLQVHPYYWTPDCYGQFDSILKHLIGAGYQFITAADRLELQHIGAGSGSPVFGGSMGASLAAQEAICGDASSRKSFGDGDSPYYLRVISEGWSKKTQFLIQIGFGSVPSSSDSKMRFVDIGAGSAVWAAALSCVHPDAEIHAIDREDRHLAPVAGLFPSGRIIPWVGDFEQAPIQDQSLSGALCNNALSYMPVTRTLAGIARMLRLEGLCFVGIQNRLYPIFDAITAARAGRYDAARSFVKRLIDSEGYLAGETARPFVVYLNHEEFTAMATLGGLKVQRTSLRIPGFSQTLGGEPIFSGYLSTKTDAIRRLRDGVLSYEIRSPAVLWYSYIESLNRESTPPDRTECRSALIAEVFYREGVKALTLPSGPSTTRLSISDLLDPLQLAVLALIDALGNCERGPIAQAISAVEDAARGLSELQLSYWQ